MGYKRLSLFGLVGCFLFCAPLAVQAQQPGLSVGQSAPDFTGITYQGKSVDFYQDYLNQGPVVLIFYRGSWCHFCNLQLQEYQQHFPEFQERGVTLLFVSVDKQEKAAAMVEEKAYSFDVIADPEAAILEAYNVIFQVPEALATMYKERYQIDLQEASGRDDRVIAVPATYVINQDGQIVYAYANENYKVRVTAEEILKIIDEKL